MLQAGVIEPSTSAWALTVVLVPRKDGKLRFCIDYRRLNAVTFRDSYPLPRMYEYIDSLGEAKVFTTLDCSSGYWQIPVAPSDREKTAFVCHAGLYQYMRMPLGLTNAPATFQRTLDIVLSSFKWRSCLVYLDDVVLFSKDVKTHIRHVDEVLGALQSAGVTPKLDKCSFFTQEVHYLGLSFGVAIRSSHQFSLGGLSYNCDLLRVSVGLATGVFGSNAWPGAINAPGASVT